MNNFKMIGLVIAVFCAFTASGQEKGKVFKKTGFFFFSASYDKYLSVRDVKHDFDFTILPDIFIPTKKGSSQINFDQDFVTTNLGKGLSIDGVLANRKNLRERARPFQNSDSLRSCYADKEYRLLPVEIKYEIIDNSHHYVPCTWPMNLMTNGRSISFTCEARNIRLLSIYMLDEGVSEAADQ